jgi:glycosyltransferase involved in cell wall biosynthesis
MPLTVLSVSYSLARVSTHTAGGAEQVLTTMDEALVRAGHRSLVLAPVGSRCHGLLIPAQIPAGVLDENARREAHRVFRQLLDRALEDYPVDIVHMHGLDFNEYLPRHTVPVIVSLHLPLTWYPPAALRPQRANVRLICVSKSQAKTAPPGVRIDTVVQNGVDLARFYPRTKKGNYAVAIGRICPEKGFHLAIDAAERAAIDLIIAGYVFGYPEHRHYFDSLIRPRLSNNVRFIGPVGGARKAHLLAGARCLLAPSLAPETSSLVAMEALASGTPVIAFPSRALIEIVVPGRTGFFANSAQQMAEEIARAGAISPGACRREAELRFSSEKMIAQYLRLYESIVRSEITMELQAA